MYKNLPDVCESKLIPKNFGHIGHLWGSKMLDNEDKLLSEVEQRKYTVSKRNKSDVVIITEKIDGMNAGVVKKNGNLYPINRKGYDTRIMGMVQKELELLGKEWAIWVDNHYSLYNSILNEGERLVFENCILQHTLKYCFKHEPVFLLAKYNSNNMRINYKELSELAFKNNIQQPPLLNVGIALPAQMIIEQYPKGLVGVKGNIEGIVYNYEHNGKHESCAKFVSNSIMGTFECIPQYYNKIASLST
ncbi:MAG: hypothetical protein K0R54_242 [Clostridiaceae bacterium]|jgi:hypothetical protein|nr:hypothetical protein [Clostridiaceae bacterium]